MTGQPASGPTPPGPEGRTPGAPSRRSDGPSAPDAGTAADRAERAVGSGGDGDASGGGPDGPARAGDDHPARDHTGTSPEGPELDYRFTLAGERTFLAWIRTSLGLLAGGVAVHELVQPFRHHDIRSALAISCIVLAAVIALGAYGRWRHVAAAMRAGRPLPHTIMVPILAIGIAVIAVLAGVGLLLS